MQSAEDIQEKAPSSTMLYVSNLPFSFDDEQLASVFSDFDVDTAYVATRRNGRSKGFGFVNFQSEDEQKKALEAVDGKELDGRTLTVKVAHRDERRNARGELKEEYRTQSEPKPRRERQERNSVVRTPSATMLYVSNLPFAYGDDDLLNIFADYNPVSARIARRRNDRSKGFGFVEFANETDQQNALVLDQTEIEDRQLTVKVSLATSSDNQEKRQKKQRQPKQKQQRPPKSTEPSVTHVYVSNLPFDLDDEGLGGLFSEQGFAVVSARVAKRRNDRSKGFGFVEFADQDTQLAAIEKLDEMEIGDRTLSVKVALKESETKPESKPARVQREKRPSATMVYVSNLPFSATDEDLAALFDGLAIKSAHVASRRNGRSKGFGFVDFENNEEQQKALAKEALSFDDRELTVEVAQEVVEAQADDNNNNNDE